MRVLLALLLHFGCALALSAAPPRVAFIRDVIAPHDLGAAEDLVIVHALGDTEQVSAFVDFFVAKLNDSRRLQATDVTRLRIYGSGGKPNEATIRRLHRDFPADLYLGVTAFTCEATPAGGESSSFDSDRKRVRLRRVWIDAICAARIDVLAASDLRRLSSFNVKGEGTSSRVTDLTGEEKGVALMMATRYAALAAAEQITPRRVRESIALDEAAPAFDDGMAMIDSGRLDEARAIWTAALPRNRDSAPLHYNLAAVCEAIGDVDAARRYFERARQLSPKEARYRIEYDLFRIRQSGRP